LNASSIDIGSTLSSLILAKFKTGAYFDITARRGTELSQPTACLYYWDNNPINSIDKIPPITNIPSNNEVPVETCASLDLFCQFRNFFYKGMETLFKPTSDDSATLAKKLTTFQSGLNTNLTAIITTPLTMIQSISTDTCTSLVMPVPFLTAQELTLPCPRSYLVTNFKDIMDLWDIIVTGLIGYWVVVGLLHQVKLANDPEDDKIRVMDL